VVEDGVMNYYRLKIKSMNVLEIEESWEMRENIV